MKARMLITQAALAAAALLFATAASPAALTTTECADLPGAEANGFAPYLCASGSLPDSSIATETASINDIFQMGGDPFEFVGKYDKESGIDGAVPGYTLTAGPAPADSGWDYLFQLLSDYTGQSVDFALLIKQPETGLPGRPDVTDVAYLWTGLVLDIDGFFNSFNSDYSHVSGFIRGVERVHEPGMLLLLGAGLIGFVLVRRRLS